MFHALCFHSLQHMKSFCLLPHPPKPRDFYPHFTCRWGPGQPSILGPPSAYPSFLHCISQCLTHFQIFKFYTPAAGSKVSVPPPTAVNSHTSPPLSLCVSCLDYSMRLCYAFYSYLLSYSMLKQHAIKLK